MRIAAISDIHGNLWALEAVLADIGQRGVDMVVNLGDILSGPLMPRATAERLMALNFPTIAGNHERQVLQGDPSTMGASDLFAHQDITDEQRDWMRLLPKCLRVGEDVLLVHGTPDSDLIYFMETVTEQGARPSSHNEVLERAGNADASLILCGHTHLPRSMRLDDGRLIVNPGSVGLQAFSVEQPFPHKAENLTPHARYCIVERGAAGWSVAQHAVAYDWDSASDLAVRNNRPEWAFALRTGRMPE
ncbi:MAG TPA: metallophosphoesterase family protein [Pseudoduganella sp.]